jgi:WhiB family redox-sensing transcriptional regulator
MSVAEYITEVDSAQPGLQPDLVRQEMAVMYGEPAREVVKRFDDEVLITMANTMGTLCVAALTEKGFKQKVEQVDIWTGALEGRSHEEQAERFGINPFTVRMRRGKMRTFMRKNLPPFNELFAGVAGIEPTDPIFRFTVVPPRRPEPEPVPRETSSTELGWWHRAACKDKDPELFFVTGAQDKKQAKRICRECEVREDCLQEAVDMQLDHGIWGGLTERERRAIRRKRGR